MAVATGSEHGLFINGEVVAAASGELRDVVEPATGEVLGRASMAGEADVDRAVEAARAALDGPWGRTPPTERSRLLHALGDAIAANRKELAELESRNVGKAISSVKAEVAGATENFRFPYILHGAVNGFNQKLLERDLIEEQLLFYAQNGKQEFRWHYFEPRTYRTGIVSEEYLTRLLARLA